MFLTKNKNEHDTNLNLNIVGFPSRNFNTRFSSRAMTLIDDAVLLFSFFVVDLVLLLNFDVSVGDACVCMLGWYDGGSGGGCF